jgi:hypothetical protein
VFGSEIAKLCRISAMRYDIFFGSAKDCSGKEWWCVGYVSDMEGATGYAQLTMQSIGIGRSDGGILGPGQGSPREGASAHLPLTFS